MRRITQSKKDLKLFTHRPSSLKSMKKGCKLSRTLFSNTIATKVFKELEGCSAKTSQKVTMCLMCIFNVEMIQKMRWARCLIKVSNNPKSLLREFQGSKGISKKGISRKVSVLIIISQMLEESIKFWIRMILCLQHLL